MVWNGSGDRGRALMARLAELVPIHAIEGPHAQFGEDRVLEKIFRDLVHGHCVEVGAYDGRTGSATLLFEQKGWRCLLVEPIPVCVEAIKRHRDCVVAGCAASSQEGEATFFVAENVEQMSTLELTPDRAQWIGQVCGAVKELTVRTATLDSLLAEAGFPEIEFITIDVEGHELEVLKGLTLELHRPRIVIIEDNSVGGDSPVARYMSDCGYVHFKRTGVNEWYARESDRGLIHPAALRNFERAKKIQCWDAQRQRLTNRIVSRVGRHLPASIKRPLMYLLDFLRRPRRRARP